MKLTSQSFTDGARIPGEFAFCIPDPAHHVCLGKNLNPQLSWTDVPAGTRSIAKLTSAPTRRTMTSAISQVMWL